ncbi:MAG TPA: CPBP family intramembrane glutamic endopeptidase [Candidatus Sulfomarinibacteraceae bacterium]|nr:CPBP family intramembrane glutamic endopeptidase [Candidatus Sulfomarinibacteraceae bacterium]
MDEGLVHGLRSLVAFGLTLLLVLLRVEASRFGAAEYDEPVGGRLPSIWRRLGWYVIGIGGVVAIVVIHPAPGAVLFMRGGDGGIFLGFVLAAVGAGAAVTIAWWRYHHVRLPDVAAYPGALVNEIATAVVDEAVFRAALLGFLVAGGMDPVLALIAQAIVYTLATRLGAPGRNRAMFLLALVIGLVAGSATLLTGGIAAAFLGHAVTRVAVFLTTGHAGQPAPRGTEVEEVERRRRTPEGWRVVAGRDGSRER